MAKILSQHGKLSISLKKKQHLFLFSLKKAVEQTQQVYRKPTVFHPYKQEKTILALNGSPKYQCAYLTKTKGHYLNKFGITIAAHSLALCAQVSYKTISELKKQFHKMCVTYLPNKLY